MNNLATPLAAPISSATSLPQRDADVVLVLSRIKRRYAGRVTAELVLPASAGCYEDFPSDLDPRLAQALRTRQVSRLYSHQREAWEAIRAGRHTVNVTPTASGKSLCYNLPVLQSVLTEQAKALYLFPTKAAQWHQGHDAGFLRARVRRGNGPGQARDRAAAYARGRFPEAIGLFREISLVPDFGVPVTLPAYKLID